MDQLTLTKEATNNIYKDLLICAALIITIGSVYLQVRSHEFINFDDQLYVTENPVVKRGVSIDGIKWAFSFSNRAYWHPLTWLSHMVDCELFGLDPGKHHLVNVFYHIVNSILLFFTFSTITGARWKSAFIAFLFALHPVNVDSVAWIAERKNLLSALFCILTILSYAYYTRTTSIYRYLLTVFVFSMGLLSKSMLVSIPFVLLLLDYWPLRRINLDFLFFKPPEQQSIPKALKGKETHLIKLILEKIPLLVLSVMSVFTSILSYSGHARVITSEQVSYGLRISNAVVSYVRYIVKLVWPANLTIYYPYPARLPMVEVLGAVIAIGFITALTLKYIRRFPYLLIGWLWYLGTLVPVSGLIQMGLWPAIAERWAYLPAIGLFIIVTYGISDLASGLRVRKPILSIMAASVICMLMVISWIQVGYWKNDYLLFTHALKVDRYNSVAYSNLGDYYVNKGKPAEAIHYYNTSLQINPYDPTTQNNFAITLLKSGRFEESTKYFNAALKSNPHDPQLYRGLGLALVQLGKTSEAIQCFSKVLEIDPKDVETHFDYAVILSKEMRIDEAIYHYEEVLKLDPDHALAKKNLSILQNYSNSENSSIKTLQDQIAKDPHNPKLYFQLATFFSRQKKLNEAIESYKKALSINPHSIDSLYGLSVVYSLKGDYNSSLLLLMKIIEIQPDNPNIYYNVACIYAKQNKVDESVKWLNDAVKKGFSNWNLMKSDSDLNYIRATEGYRQIIKGK